MEDKFGLFVSLFLGLIVAIRFRTIVSFLATWTKGLPAVFPISHKWEVLFAQGLCLIVGSIIFTISLFKLLL